MHYIIGNHEMKHLQGNFRSPANKYIPISGILGKTQPQLFSNESVIGRWLASKNSIELINGNLFVHGGIHPEVIQLNMTLQAINNHIRNSYRNFYYPSVNENPADKLLLSTTTDPTWFRGLFKNKVSEQELDKILTAFNANTMVVGHTIQFKVDSRFNGKLIAIDVKHPSDYQHNLPSKSSET